MKTRISRRDVLTTAAAGAVAIGLQPRRSFALQSAPATITWWDYYPAGNANDVATTDNHKKYMAAHPNVKIERTSIPFADLKTKLLQGAAAGQLPDIAVIDNPDHQAFAALGILADLTDRVTAWGQAQSYFQGPWASTVWQQKNYGIPDNSNCLVLWYASDVLAAAKVNPPTNWDELKAAAAATTSGDRFGLAVSGVKSEEGTFQWLPFLWETGEDIATIDSDGGRRALQLWVDLVNASQMSKGILGWTQGDVNSQFENGKAAMMVNGPWQIPTLKKDVPNLKWNVVTLPVDKQGASILGGENYTIVKSSKVVDAAWDYLTWSQQPENLKPYLIEAGKLPSRQDMAGDPAWTADPVLKVFIDQLKVAKPRAYGDKYPQISNAIQDAIQAAVSGQTDVASALKTASQAIAPLLPKS